MFFLLLLVCLPLSANAQSLPEEEPPRPFARGTSLGGLVLGFGTSGGRSSFTFGASYGYFVLDGVAPGLSAVVTTSSGAPNTLELAPFVRIVPFRYYPVSPMLIVKGGRLFIENLPDLWLVGGGGGIVYFASPRMALTIEVVYTRFLPDSLCPGCDQVSVSGGLGLMF